MFVVTAKNRMGGFSYPKSVHSSLDGAKANKDACLSQGLKNVEIHCFPMNGVLHFDQEGVKNFKINLFPTQPATVSNEEGLYIVWIVTVRSIGLYERKVKYASVNEADAQKEALKIANEILHSDLNSEIIRIDEKMSYYKAQLYDGRMVTVEAWPLDKIVYADYMIKQTRKIDENY